MSQENKEKVIAYAKSDRSFDGACKIYRTLPGAHKGLIRRMNGGDQGNLLELLRYYMAQAVGISEREMNTMLAQPLEKPNDDVTLSATSEGSGVSKGGIIEFDPLEIPEEDIPKIDVQKAGYYDLLGLSVRLDLELPDRKGDTVKDALTKYVEHNRAKAVVATLPEEAIKALRLRDEFPFLREADCPDELKILTADRRTAYYKYVEAHESIQTKTLTEEQLAEAAKTVLENYLENRLIWKELKHYQDTKEPLGEHPIWRTKKLREEIMALDVKGLIKKTNSLASSKSIAGKNIEKEKKEEKPDEGKIKAWTNSIEEKEWLQELIKTRLDNFDKS